LYALALEEPSAEPLAALAFLTAAEGYTKDSARAFLRAQPGFLGRGLALEEAKELKAAALAAGFKTVLAAETDIPALTPALKVSKLEFRDTGFSFEAGGAIHTLDFGSVAFLTAAAFDAPAPPLNLDAIKKDAIFDKIMTLAGDPPFQPITAAGARETFFRAYIIAGGGQLRLLLDPAELDFSPLGPSRSHSSLVNFRELLKRLAACCPKAVGNAFLSAFLENKPVSQLKLADAGACEVELSRLLLVTPKER
jgi:hypothetical protein